jgi:hypothetical protein
MIANCEPKCNVVFLCDNMTGAEANKVLGFIEEANNMVAEFFGTRTTFDVIICHGNWEMEIQIISRRSDPYSWRYNITASVVAITDYNLEEIVIRYDSAKFGHYLHELIHGIISERHTHQLKEGLAWYFTLKLTKPYRYVRPSYPSWIDFLYVAPIRKMARITGDDFLKDFTLGKASIEERALPTDIQELFLPEELFYSKPRFYKDSTKC